MCVCIRPGLCLCLCVSVLRALVACKKVWLQMSFRSIVIVVFALCLPPSIFDQQHKQEHSVFILNRRLGLPPPPHTQAAGEPTKRSYEAPAGDITSDRREVCLFIRPGLSIRVCILPARVGCLPKSLVAIEFSQHRRGSFRLVIISLHI